MIKNFIIFLFLLSINFKSIADHVGVIGRQENYTITKNEVKQLFLLKRKRFSTGELSTLVQMNSNSTLHKLFVREILGMNIETYKKIIYNSINSGFNGNIITVSTQEEMINKVSTVSNSIGYIDSNIILINSNYNNITIYKIID